MLAKPQGFPRKLGGCAGLDPRLRSAVSAGVGDGERGLRRGLRAPGVGVRPKWVLEYSPSNKRIRYFVSITYVRTGLWTAHKFCGGGDFYCAAYLSSAPPKRTAASDSCSQARRKSFTMMRRPARFSGSDVGGSVSGEIHTARAPTERAPITSHSQLSPICSISCTFTRWSTATVPNASGSGFE